MQASHMPRVNTRYWLAITMASLFGTNMGDLYAHELHLGIYRGLAVLAVLAAAVFVAERRDAAPRLLYYWLVIVIIRTGATNIADFLAYKVKVPDALLCLGLAAIIAGFGAISVKARAGGEGEDFGMPDTGAAYWIAMLGAGVFGTVLGDLCSHIVGEGIASLGLMALLLIALAIWRAGGTAQVWLYWLVIAVARTAGTAMGDWLAESPSVNIGLPLATSLTGVAFILCTMLTAAKGERTAAAL